MFKIKRNNNKDKTYVQSTSFIYLATAKSLATLTTSNFQSGLSKNLMECQLIANEDCFEKLFLIEKSQ